MGIACTISSQNTSACPLFDAEAVSERLHLCFRYILEHGCHCPQLAVSLDWNTILTVFLFKLRLLGMQFTLQVKLDNSVEGFKAAAEE